MPSLSVAVSKNKAICEKVVSGYLEELKEGKKTKKNKTKPEVGNTLTVLVLPKQKWHTKAETVFPFSVLLHGTTSLSVKTSLVIYFLIFGRYSVLYCQCNDYKFTTWKMFRMLVGCYWRSLLLKKWAEIFTDFLRSLCSVCNGKKMFRNTVSVVLQYLKFWQQKMLSYS